MLNRNSTNHQFSLFDIISSIVYACIFSCALCFAIIKKFCNLGDVNQILLVREGNRDFHKDCLQYITLYRALNETVAQLDAPSDWRPGGRGFNPRRGRQHSFVEIDHEIFSMVILPLPLIQEGQLSVSGERMCTILVNRLED